MRPRGMWIRINLPISRVADRTFAFDHHSLYSSVQGLSSREFPVWADRAIATARTARPWPSVAKFVSFPDINEHAYFAIGKKAGVWNAVLPNHFIERLAKMQRAIPDFDATRTGILFVKARRASSPFKVASTPLSINGVLRKFPEPGCCIERGSALCSYGSQFFFLKFNAGERTVHTRWNLLIAIATTLAELKELAEAPEDA
ncbi:hypothetical protein FB451DRAFT_1414367 [Mycena latifolia]|nr:hypothetical protein FB451DRAFT_1414367 [Mycena latifolia]